MPVYSHELGDVAALLDDRIARLRSLKTQVTEALKSGRQVQVNAEALRQISASLAHARDARAAIEESCCGQVCPISYDI